MKSLFLKIKCLFNFGNFSNHIRNKFFIKANPVCRIEEINLEKKMIIIHCRGINSPIKLHLAEAIHDSMILSNLSPKQASWIGYYYGKYHKNLTNNKKNHGTFIDLTMDEKPSKFKIQMLDRQSNIIYSCDKSHYTIQPIKALNNESIINNFTPIHACYIGILAGTSPKKTIDNRPNHVSKINLKIIK